jgi:hypothetical protein
MNMISSFLKSLNDADSIEAIVSNLVIVLKLNTDIKIIKPTYMDHYK